MRLDPKLKYLAELAARKQRRSLANFVEWAIEDVLTRVAVQEGASFHSDSSVTFAEADLWDVDEATRFARLAIRYPELLTYDEQLLWKLVRENGHFWRLNYSSTQASWSWEIQERSLLMEKLRQYWITLKAVSAGEQAPTSLPDWVNSKPKKPVGNVPDPGGFEDDDIPF